MASLCKNVLSCGHSLRICGRPTLNYLSKRFLQVDPEEEIDRLFIKKSFEQRMSELKAPKQKFTVVGKAPPQSSSLSQTSIKKSKTTDSVTDQNAGKLLSDVIPPEDLQLCSSSSLNQEHFVQVLNHYHIFKDMLPENTIFHCDPGLNMGVGFPMDQEDVLMVFTGNRLYPKDTLSEPLVQFTGKEDKLYSLFLVNLDGHLEKEDREYLHWYCVNMTGALGGAGGERSTYLPAIPVRGTGYHRYVFILLEHSSPLSLDLLPKIKQEHLRSRDFNFCQFYNSLAEVVVPVGLQFFQTEWDESVKSTFHHTLDMPEPAYEYDYDEKVRKPQVKYAHRLPFQTYLDRYRDRREIAEQVLKEHISQYSPFKPLDEQVSAYPLATPTKPGLYPEHLPPTWLQKEKKHKVNKTGKYQYIYSESI